MSKAAGRYAEEAEAAAEADRRTEADKEAASAQVSKVEQAAAPAPVPKEKDIFCLIAEAAEADEVARTEAAATDIQSVLRMIPHKSALPIRMAVLTEHQILMLCSDGYCNFLAKSPSLGLLDHKCDVCWYNWQDWLHGTLEEKTRIYRAVRNRLGQTGNVIGM